MYRDIHYQPTCGGVPCPWSSRTIHQQQNHVMLKEDLWTVHLDILKAYAGVAPGGGWACRSYQEQQQLLETEIDGELPDVVQELDIC